MCECRIKYRDSDLIEDRGDVIVHCDLHRMEWLLCAERYRVALEQIMKQTIEVAHAAMKDT